MFDDIRTSFDQEIAEVSTKEDMKVIHDKYFSKKGLLTQLFKDISKVDDKKTYGNEVNKLKVELETKRDEVMQQLDKAQMETKLLKKEIDVTLPAREVNVGVQSPLLKTRSEVEKIFVELGYEIMIGAEVEDEHYNFEALNLESHHPARDMQDTLYVDDTHLLRTHTSNVQSRILSATKEEEFSIICPGKVYRRDDDDATHSHQFTQIEGLRIVRKENAELASLKALKMVLTVFVKRIFEREDMEIRMRPSYFPFTEPSVEVDAICSNCLGEGCSVCKQTGWIEVLGAGIVNKRVLELNGYDSDEFTGFAFGIGIERIAMIKYNITDIRDLYSNDIRVIKQFDKR